MRTVRAAGIFFFLLFGCVARADERIDRELGRLEQVLKAAEAAALPEDVKPLFESYRGALERAKRAPSPEYQLYRLRDPFVGIETLAFLAKNNVDSVERFEVLWKANRARFEAKPPAARGSLLQRALIESAVTRAGRLYRASLPYAKAAKPWSGVYYLGEADANLRFRDFVESLAVGSTEKAPSRAQIAAMLDSLERTTVTFFAGDVANQSMVPVSVRLKEAHELLDAGRLDGATLLLVEARAALSRRGGPKGTYPPNVTPRAGSIVAFLNAWADDEQAPMNDALRQEVVPFYGAIFHTPVEDRRSRLSNQVTVTLVRWPYT